MTSSDFSPGPDSKHPRDFSRSPFSKGPSASKKVMADPKDCIVLDSDEESDSRDHLSGSSSKEQKHAHRTQDSDDDCCMLPGEWNPQGGRLTEGKPTSKTEKQEECRIRKPLAPGASRRSILFPSTKLPANRGFYEALALRRKPQSSDAPQITKMDNEAPGSVRRPCQPTRYAASEEMPGLRKGGTGQDQAAGDKLSGGDHAEIQLEAEKDSKGIVHGNNHSGKTEDVVNERTRNRDGTDTYSAQRREGRPSSAEATRDPRSYFLKRPTPFTEQNKEQGVSASPPDFTRELPPGEAQLVGGCEHTGNLLSYKGTLGPRERLPGAGAGQPGPAAGAPGNAPSNRAASREEVLLLDSDSEEERDEVGQASHPSRHETGGAGVGGGDEFSQRPSEDMEYLGNGQFVWKASGGPASNRLEEGVKEKESIHRRNGASGLGPLGPTAPGGTVGEKMACDAESVPSRSKVRKGSDELEGYSQKSAGEFQPTSDGSSQEGGASQDAAKKRNTVARKSAEEKEREKEEKAQERERKREEKARDREREKEERKRKKEEERETKQRQKEADAKRRRKLPEERSWQALSNVRNHNTTCIDSRLPPKVQEAIVRALEARNFSHRVVSNPIPNTVCWRLKMLEKCMCNMAGQDSQDSPPSSQDPVSQGMNQDEALGCDTNSEQPSQGGGGVSQQASQVSHGQRCKAPWTVKCGGCGLPMSSVSEGGELRTRTEMPPYVALFVDPEALCAQVREGTFGARVRSVQDQIGREASLCVLVPGLHKFIDRKEQQSYRGKGVWETPPVTLALAQLATHFTRVRHWACAHEQEAGEHIAGLHRTLAEAPYRPKTTRFHLMSNGGTANKKDRFYEEVRYDTWRKVLLAIPNVAARDAIAISKEFPSMKALLCEYFDPEKMEKEKEQLLMDIRKESRFDSQEGDSSQPMQRRDRIGPALSARVYHSLTCRDAKAFTRGKDWAGALNASQ